ncbi:MAG: molybdenum cofactor synthesis domain-containing protein [Myxococcota bacterium]|jgi:molybdenum cofactor synthesis domain-containing protein
MTDAIPQAPAVRPTAAAIIIGNEILSGKVEEKNAAFLIGRFRALGVRLAEVAFIEDTREAIVSAIHRLSPEHDFVVTTGGVGPTHDDVTMSAVADAFGVSLVDSEELKTIMTRLMKAAPTPGHLRMTWVPDGSESVYGADMPWPTTKMRNVFIFPGVPWLLRAKFQDIEGHFASTHRVHLGVFELDAEEAHICESLDAIVGAHPNVEIGSYPRYEAGAWKIRLTVEALGPAPILAAMTAIRTAIGPLIVSETPPDNVLGDAPG